MPFACIFVPDFPAEAILRAEPGLRSQAVAVLEGKPPLQKVYAVNENARRAGIEPGMKIIKVDLLGLGMMAVLEDSIRLIRDDYHEEVDLAHLPPDDPEVYATLQKADTVGMPEAGDGQSLFHSGTSKPRLGQHKPGRNCFRTGEEAP